MSPDGHQMVIEATPVLLPSPKISSFECCEMKPDPAVTTRVTRPCPVSTVTRAPMASRLLFVPVSRTASALLPEAKSFRNSRSCGADRGDITATSGLPSPLTSRTAKERPS